MGGGGSQGGAASCSGQAAWRTAVPSSSNYASDPEVGRSSPLRCCTLKSRASLCRQAEAAALQVWDLVVVGAGVAGSALAFSQGKVRSMSFWFCVASAVVNKVDCPEAGGAARIAAGARPVRARPHSRGAAAAGRLPHVAEAWTRLLLRRNRLAESFWLLHVHGWQEGQGRLSVGGI